MLCQLLEQGFGLLQVSRIESSGEPSVDRGQQVADLGTFALVLPQVDQEPIAQILGDIAVKALQNLGAGGLT